MPGPSFPFQSRKKLQRIDSGGSIRGAITAYAYPQRISVPSAGERKKFKLTARGVSLVEFQHGTVRCVTSEREEKKKGEEKRKRKSIAVVHGFFSAG